MSYLTVWCLAVSDACKPVGDIFKVKVAPSDDIHDLKKNIFAERKDLGLQAVGNLFLWKLNEKLVVDDHSVLLEVTRTLQLNFMTGKEDNNRATYLSPMKKISKALGETLQEDCVHVLVQILPSQNGNAGDTDALRKRKRDDPVDISKILLDKWNTPLPVLPQVHDLVIHLDAPLNPEEKIPISGMEWRKLLQENILLPDTCYPADLERLFTRSEDETCALFIHSMPETIVHRPPDSAFSKASFHSLWDFNIRDILSKCLGWPKLIRTSNHGTHTGSFTPDFGLFFQLACVFRGEEEKPWFSGKHPRQNLADKTRWVYDPAPYILGYHAVGVDVTIAAIRPGVDTTGKKQIIIKDILKADLSTRPGRIRNAVQMIQLVKVLRTLEQIVPKNVDADMFRLTCEDGKSIDFFKKRIRKTYQIKDTFKVSFLKSIYDKLEAKGVPNVDRLTRIELDHPEHGCFVELEPRGDAQGPNSADDVKNAVICVLEALQILHAEPPMFHRDVRWPNVLRNVTEPSRWFLIDWEDASFTPTKAAPNLRQGIHAPQVLKDGHGAEVDIWGVGRLIRTAQVADLPENLRSLGRRMVDGSILSAEQALQELKSTL